MHSDTSSRLTRSTSVEMDADKLSADVPPSPSSTETPSVKDYSQEGGKRPPRGNEAFEAWERDAMENLLKDLRGQLGKVF
jgi:hypothetical protein